VYPLHEIVVSELKILHMSEINLYDILWTEMMQSNSVEGRLSSSDVHHDGHISQAYLC